MRKYRIHPIILFDAKPGGFCNVAFATLTFKRKGPLTRPFCETILVLFRPHVTLGMSRSNQFKAQGMPFFFQTTGFCLEEAMQRSVPSTIPYISCQGCLREHARKRMGRFQQVGMGGGVKFEPWQLCQTILQVKTGDCH